jgi:hypothetical protein
MLFKEIIAVYIENSTKSVNTRYSVQIVKDKATIQYIYKTWRSEPKITQLLGSIITIIVDNAS